MKKTLIFLITGIFFLIFNGFVFAAEQVYTYTYQPGSSPYDLQDLEHGTAYAWGIDASAIIDAGQTITGASLFFNDIRNWRDESNVLFVSALNTNDTTDVGVRQYSDNLNEESDYFHPGDAYNSVSLFNIEDIHTAANDYTVDLVNLGQSYDSWLKSDVPGQYSSHFAAERDNMPGNRIDMGTGVFTALMSYASDGVFGLGFDPDCHFYNNGITLTLTATKNVNVVPEPATLMLFGAGLLCFASRMRKKVQA